LPATLIDLVYLRVSQLNGCAYCIYMHGRDLLLVSAWDEAGSFSTTRKKPR
jgi:AhpD family alkylhydroperoxidase